MRREQKLLLWSEESRMKKVVFFGLLICVLESTSDPGERVITDKLTLEKNSLLISN